MDDISPFDGRSNKQSNIKPDTISTKTPAKSIQQLLNNKINELNNRIYELTQNSISLEHEKTYCQTCLMALVPIQTTLAQMSDNGSPIDNYIRIFEPILIQFGVLKPGTYDSIPSNFNDATTNQNNNSV